LGGGLVLAIAAIASLAGLSSSGIWDPWELDAADAARRLAQGHASGQPDLGTWLVSVSFQWLGVREWTGRAPIAASGLLTVGLALWLVARFAGTRAGLYAALITATSPLFLFNARAMLGDAPLFAIQTMIAATGAAALLPSEGYVPTRARVLALIVCIASCLIAVLGCGALVGALPPVLALSALALFESKLTDPRDRVGAYTGWVLCALAIMLMGAITQDVLADRPVHSVWLGGAPRSAAVPSFEFVIERVFHAFAPWSALLPIALARMLVEPPHDPAGVQRRMGERRLRVLVLLWAAAGYGAQTLFVSRYGSQVTFLPVVALAAAVALLLRDVERSNRSLWPMAIGALMLVGLLVRDFALYPHVPASGLPVHEVTVPKVFNPKLAWAGTLGVFAVAAALAFGTAPNTALALRAPYRALVTQWRRGVGAKLWILLGATVAIALIVLGIVAWAGGKKVGMSTQAVRWLKVIGWLPLFAPVALIAAQVALWLQGKLGRARIFGILAAGTLTAGWAVFGFLPKLSAHVSPREVYATYNELAGDNEPLAEHGVGSRAAAYYAKGEVLELTQQGELLDYLAQPGRRWAALPADRLAEIDRAFRRKSGRHLFVADAKSARVVLTASEPVEGRENESFLVRSVLRKAPKIQHPVQASFDGKIELLGYDLKLPHGDHVGAGESFELTWYFRSVKPVSGGYRVFVHIDNGGQRVHGDHDPIDGNYPVKLWDVGDIIVDRQRIDVGGHIRGGAFKMFVGFYAGDHRLPVTEGPKDDADRVRVGVLRIR
jgi:hypothetical protein